MAAEPPIIAPFEDLDGTQEVVGLGPIRAGSGDAAEREYAVLLARIAEDGSFVRDIPNIRWLGCGQLALTPVGTRWNAGRTADAPPLRQYAGTISITTDAPIQALGTSQPIAAERKADGTVLPAIPHFPIDKLATAFVYSVRIDHEGPRPLLALLPVMEVLRSAFGVSSAVLRTLFDGAREANLLPARAWVDERKSGWIDEDAGRYRLWAERHLSRAEIQLAMMLMLDEHARRAFNLVHQRLTTSDHWRQYRKAHAVAPWPLPPETRVEVEGRWIGRVRRDGEKPGRRFLVTRIHLLDMPLPVRVVEFSYPNEATDPGQGRGHGGALVGPKTVRLVTGRAPGGFKATVQLSAVAGARVEASFEIVPIPRGNPRPPGKPVDAGPGENLRSTGDRRPGGDPRVGSTNARTRGSSAEARQRAARERLVAIRQTLAALNAMPGMEGPPKLHSDITVDGMPVVALALTDTGAVVPMLLAEIATATGSVAVADAGTCSLDERALGLVVRLDCGPFQADDIARLIAEARERSARWLNAGIAGCIVRGVRRPVPTREDHLRYIDLLRRGIEDLFARALKQAAAS